MDEKRSAKKDVIEEALRRMGKSPGDHDILMIGDCMHDVEGAKLSFAAWTTSASIRALRRGRAVGLPTPHMFSIPLKIWRFFCSQTKTTSNVYCRSSF